MERLIQPYGPGPGGPIARPLDAAAAPAFPPKLAGDYARAVRRRAWLVLLVALPVGLAGAAYVAKLPPIYQALAEIEITAPRFDANFSLIIDSPAGFDRDAAETYVPNRMANLRGRTLAAQAVADAELGPGPGGIDPVAELLAGLTWRQIPRTSYYQVNAESQDPDRAARGLNALLKRFQVQAEDENKEELHESVRLAKADLDGMERQLKAIDDKINGLIDRHPTFTPAGKDLRHEELAELKVQLVSRRVRFDDLQHEGRIAGLWPQLKGPPPGETPRARQIALLLDQKDQLTEMAEEARRRTRHFNTDPTARAVTKRLSAVLDALERLQAQPETDPAPDLAKITLAHTAEEVRKLQRQYDAQQAGVLAAMPQFREYVALLKRRELKEQELTAQQGRLSRFDRAAKTQRGPVKVRQEAAAPTAPIKPNRPLLIGLFAAFGLALGVGLVCLIEALDHSVKEVGHLSVLGLPLLGVVPRLRRLAQTQRGGHLWTAGAPASLEADAYRNLHASLVACGGPDAPVVTLIVTSALAGEGKSTTALNLAATCARAGERTILVDCDLRRPSLADVFDAAEPRVGLVDVLRGDMPWQQAVVRTELPNLNFLPTGDPTGVAIEVLGTLELRQLLAALAGQYHRVILDGPAVLGLADCRLLGRAVDAALLVVRSGAHELRPVRHAQEMLAQSKVTIAGVVFNDLSEGLHHWSSYGPHTAYGPAPAAGLAAPATSDRDD